MNPEKLLKINKIIQLKPEEEVLQIIHEAMPAALPRFIGFALLLAIPFLFLFPLFREGTWGVMVFLTLLLVLGTVAYRAFFQWSRTVLVITDKRVVDHDQAGFFSRVITQARYHQLDEVICQIKGVGPTLFRYGTVKLHVHGSAADIAFHRTPQPNKVTDLINDLRTDHEDS